MFVTVIVGVELPEEQDPADVDVVNVVVQLLTVELALNVEKLRPVKSLFVSESIYLQVIVEPLGTDCVREVFVAPAPTDKLVLAF